MVQGFDPKTYTVAWICAIKDEVTASRALLDEKHERPPSQPNDENVYIVGRMERHNVVIASPGSGSYGADVIAHVVAHLVRTFQNIRFGLMVGIGGGAPSLPDLTDALNDIRLGDVVISEPKGNHGKNSLSQYQFDSSCFSAFDRISDMAKVEFYNTTKAGGKIPKGLRSDLTSIDHLAFFWPL